MKNIKQKFIPNGLADGDTDLSTDKPHVFEDVKLLEPRHFIFLLLLAVIFPMMSCTLYRSPDAVIENKSRALDLYLFAKNTNSPEYYDIALSYAVIPAAYFYKGEHALQENDWVSARNNYDLALHYSRNYGIATSRLEYLAFLEDEGRLEAVSIAPAIITAPEEIDERDLALEKKDPDSLYVPDVPKDELPLVEKPPFEIVTSSRYPFREEPVAPTGVVINPLREVEYHLDKARLLYQHRLFDEAIEELRIVIENLDYTKEPEPYLLLLGIHQARRDERKAQNVIELMQTLFPEQEDIYFQAALYYIERGNFKRAIESLLKAVELNPDEPRYHNNLGICYRKTGKNRQAEEAYRTAINVDPDFADAYLNLGILFEMVFEDTEKAIENYEKYVTLEGPRADEVQLWIEDIR